MELTESNQKRYYPPLARICNPCRSNNW